MAAAFRTEGSNPDIRDAPLFLYTAVAAAELPLKPVLDVVMITLLTVA